MKKTSIIVVLLLCVNIFLACDGALYNKSLDNIAEIRHNIYVGENDSVKATFMSGEREKDYIINGYATPLIEFGILTFYVNLDNVTNAKEGTYTLEINNQTFQGKLELNPFDNTYVADIGTFINEDTPLITSITIGSFSTQLELNKLNNNWELDAYEALKLACKNLKSEIKDFDNDDWESEVYVKIIHDDDVSKDDYYWYINFAGRNGTTHSIIINPITKEILAKK